MGRLKHTLSMHGKHEHSEMGEMFSLCADAAVVRHSVDIDLVLQMVNAPLSTHTRKIVVEASVIGFIF